MSAMYNAFATPGTRMHAYLAGSGGRPQARFGPWVAWQLHQLRQWDVDQQSRPNRLIANSAFHGAADPALLGAPVFSSPIPRENVERFAGNLHGEEVTTSSSAGWCPKAR